MPLHGKVPFKRKIPKGVAHLDQELFFCKPTKEVFTSYEELFERAIECSSLVWNCSLTGRGGLTFQEALDSEEKARKSLQSIPWQLKRLLLMQVNKCKATRLQDLSEKVFALVHNIFVLGEVVEVTFHGIRRTCEVTDIKPPGSSSRVKSPAKSPGKKTNESPKKVSPSKMRYEVTEKESEIEVLHTVSPDSLSRPKGALSKDKTKLFLKQSVESQDGILRVKNSLTQKYQLVLEVPGQPASKKPKLEKASKTTSPVKSVKPSKPVTPNKSNSVKNALKNSQSPSKLKKTLKSIDADIRKMFPKNSKLSPQSKENNPVPPVDGKTVKEMKLEESKKRKLDLKEKRKTEAKLLNEYLIEWRRRREDLECDDLRDLPMPTPINCGIPRDSFGDAIAVMEFLHQFTSVLQLRNTFPSGFKLELMEKVLNDTDIQGPFSDLLHALLLAVFRQQDVEEEEPDKVKESSLDKEDDDTTAAAIKMANAAAGWSIQNLGCMIRRFPLDPFTLTELLRLHLMASGADISTIASDRGGFKNIDDPGLAFKINNPGLMQKLSITPVFLCSPEERIKILTILIEQLLTYPTFRDIFDKNIRCLKEARQELATLYKTRRSFLKSTEPSSTIERDADKDPEALLLNGENGPVPVLSPKEPHVMTEDEKAELAQFEQKVKELKTAIIKIQKFFRVEPIGSDRAHRTYWVFNTVDGLFVEDSNPYAGQCLAKPTPTHVTINGNVSQDEIPLSLMHKFLRIINNGHDKENNLSKSNKQSNTNTHKKMLSNLNGLSPLKAGSPDKKKIGRVVFGMCTANPTTCLVHGPNPNRVTWGFFHDEKDLENLMNGLNSRGNREFSLKKTLVQEKPRIKEAMEKCPTTKLNILTASNDEELTEQRKSLRLQAEKSPFSGIHPEEALEAALRDAILDNEEKIWTGGLGTMKVQNREAWRTAIENNSYDPQCAQLPDSNISPAIPVTFDSNVQSAQLQSDVTSAVNSENSQTASTSHSPSTSSALSPNIKDLARAILQLAMCVQPRYLGEPLAAGEAYKRQLEKAEAEVERRKQKDELDDGKKRLRPVKIPKSPLDRWKESLMACTSLSQLFLHLITLENSISWHRSALKASCKICRKRGDAEKMLLCDKCDRGFHMYCLKPPLEDVPTGDWFCLSCIPEPEREEKAHRKKRRTLNYKEACSDEDEEENSEDNSESASDIEDDEPQHKRTKRDKDDEDRNSNRCTACHKGGELICCDGCPESLHLKCVRPPLRRIPRGKWFCQKCVKSGRNVSHKDGSDSTSSNTRGNADKRTSESGESTGRPSRNSHRGSSDLFDAASCEEVVELLGRHQDSWPFKTKRRKADYKRIVKRPVDLNSIELKVKDGSYASNMQFVADIYLMFQNCELVNSLQNEQEASKRLSRYFQTLLRRFKFEDANDVGDLISMRPRRAY